MDISFSPVYASVSRLKESWNAEPLSVRMIGKVIENSSGPQDSLIIINGKKEEYDISSSQDEIII